VTFEKLDAHPQSHIVGELRYVSDGGRKVTALAVYDMSLPSAQPPVVLPPIRAEIVGDAKRIRCTCCIHRQDWEIGKSALQALFARREVTVVEVSENA
jgi:hypothetical protein